MSLRTQNFETVLKTPSFRHHTHLRFTDARTREQKGHAKIELHQHNKWTLTIESPSLTIQQPPLSKTAPAISLDPLIPPNLLHSQSPKTIPSSQNCLQLLQTHHFQEEIHMGPLMYKKPDGMFVYYHLRRNTAGLGELLSTYTQASRTPPTLPLLAPLFQAAPMAQGWGQGRGTLGLGKNLSRITDTSYSITSYSHTPWEWSQEAFQAGLWASGPHHDGSE